MQYIALSVVTVFIRVHPWLNLHCVLCASSGYSFNNPLNPPHPRLIPMEPHGQARGSSIASAESAEAYPTTLNMPTGKLRRVIRTHSSTAKAVVFCAGG